MDFSPIKPGAKSNLVAAAATSAQSVWLFVGVVESLDSLAGFHPLRTVLLECL